METTSKTVPGNGANAAQDHLSSATSQAAGIAMMNAVTAQQQGYVTAAATVTMTVTHILAGQAPPEETATAAKLGAPSPSAMPTSNAVASEANFAMIAQAWAIAAQDAAAYLRNVEIIATAAMGAALAALTRGGSGGDPGQVLQAAQTMVANAETNLQQICTQAGEALKEFPRAP